MMIGFSIAFLTGFGAAKEAGVARYILGAMLIFFAVCAFGILVDE
jgi:hypothetical protein